MERRYGPTVGDFCTHVGGLPLIAYVEVIDTSTRIHHGTVPVQYYNTVLDRTS